jgi:predicted dehydrogenase
MKIAVIGAGNWGKNLVRTFHELGHLGPVVEPSAANHGNITSIDPAIPILPDHSSLLTNTHISAVAIATPAHTHFEIAKAFLLADKDVFVEKPITLCSQEAAELHQIALDRQRVLMTGHLLLYHSAIDFIAGFLRSGQLGNLFTLHLERAKLGRARSAENALWSLGVHDVAVLLHLVGTPPHRVSSYAHAGLQPTIADDVYLHLDFPNNVKATLHTSWLWPEDSRCLRIIGSHGMLVYDEHSKKVLLHPQFIDADLIEHRAPPQILFESTTQPLTRELEHFIDCITQRKTPLTDGLNGLAVVQVLEQATTQP